MSLRRRNKPSALDRHRAMAERESDLRGPELGLVGAAVTTVISGLAALYSCYEIATEGPSGLRVVVLILSVPATFLLLRSDWRKMMRARRLKESLFKARLKRLSRRAENR